MPSLIKTAAGRRLQKLASSGLSDEDVLKQTDRRQRFHRRCEGIELDFSKQLVSDAVFDALIQLGYELGVIDQLRAQFSGEIVNRTENRPALHTVLRGTPAPSAPDDEALARQERERFLAFAAEIRSGARRGFSGLRFKNLVHLGIGGSHLGPEFVCSALGRGAVDVHFISALDSSRVHDVLGTLDPATTLIVVATKSFTTAETTMNLQLVRSWFVERVGVKGHFDQHVVYISANAQALAQQDGTTFRIPNSVGGRFSVWSAVGLPIAIAYGPAAFESFLRGAKLVDQHVAQTPLADNVPILLALLGVWNTCFLGLESHAVLPYDPRLTALVPYLQQLELESNGKSITRDCETTDTPTAPVVWGGPETNAQHAFHQFLQQGTRSFSADFLVTAPDPIDDGFQSWNFANCLAQSRALLTGFHSEQDKHRSSAGRHPSNTILVDQVTPQNLGSLLAMYEHKVASFGALLNINSFDQWGVEFGKHLADEIYAELQTQATARVVDKTV